MKPLKMLRVLLIALVLAFLFISNVLAKEIWVEANGSNDASVQVNFCNFWGEVI